MQLSWAGLGWAGLAWPGLDWTGLGWARLGDTSLYHSVTKGDCVHVRPGLLSNIYGVEVVNIGTRTTLSPHQYQLT